MSFVARLYRFSKPTNSTAIPTEQTPTITYNCVAVEPMSLAAPVVRLLLNPSTTTAEQIQHYNYMFLEPFGRYYWITDWEFRDRCWFVHGQVDALGTYRTAIGDMWEYVLRASAEFDGTIQDNFYPVKASWTTSQVLEITPWQLGGYNSGCYSVGIISAGGITSFWLMSRATLEQLLAYILSDGYASSVLSALTIDAYPEAKAVLDPLQYIASVTWIPLELGETLLTTVRVGYGSIALNVRSANPSVPDSRTLTFTRPTHPQAGSRGQYLNIAPYTRLSLFVPPFGVIELDTTSVQTSATITARIWIDMCLGNGALEIQCGDYTLSRVCARIGMPVQLSQVIAPGYGLLSAAGTAANVVSDVISGNFGGAANALASGIGNAITGQIPSANTVGSVGSIDSLVGRPKLQAVFGMPANDDLLHRGRPLCAIRQIKTIPGYIMCADVESHVSGATSTEMNEIKNQMESGFYYA